MNSLNELKTEMNVYVKNEKVFEECFCRDLIERGAADSNYRWYKISCQRT